MADRQLTTEQILALLTEAPPRIAALAAGLTPAQLRASPVPDEWSANEVLAHLRSCADVWGDAIATILTEDHPRLRAVNPRTWITSTNYPDLAFRTSLRAYTRQRADLLARLETLAPADWSRAATVTGAGKPLEQSVHRYADRLARHERAHVNQIARLIPLLKD
jgi:hypothetical protein